MMPKKVMRYMLEALRQQDLAVEEAYFAEGIEVKDIMAIIAMWKQTMKRVTVATGLNGVEERKELYHFLSRIGASFLNAFNEIEDIVP